MKGFGSEGSRHQEAVRNFSGITLNPKSNNQRMGTECLRVQDLMRFRLEFQGLRGL